MIEIGRRVLIGSLPIGSFFESDGRLGRFDGLCGIDAKVSLWNSKRIGDKVIRARKREYWSSSVMVLTSANPERHIAGSNQQKESRKMSKAKRTMKQTKTESMPPKCLCGCDERTKGGRFIPGHDARLKSTLLRAYRGKGLSARQTKLVVDLGWEKLIKVSNGLVQDGAGKTDRRRRPAVSRAQRGQDQPREQDAGLESVGDYSEGTTVGTE